MSEHWYRIDPQEKDAALRFFAPGNHIGWIGDPDGQRQWSHVLHREPTRILVAHWNRAIADVAIEGDYIVGCEIIEGERARELYERYAAG